MKRLLVFGILSAFLANFSFAAETETECPMMRESNNRENPKQNLSSTVKPVSKSKSTSSRQ